MNRYGVGVTWTATSAAEGSALNFLNLPLTIDLKPLRPQNEFLSMSALTSAVWSSYTKYEGPGSTPAGYCFMISVVLDAGAWKLFSGIRVILVYRETVELQNVVGS